MIPQNESQNDVIKRSLPSCCKPSGLTVGFDCNVTNQALGVKHCFGQASSATISSQCFFAKVGGLHRVG